MHQDVGRYSTTFNLTKMQAGVCELNQFLRNMAYSTVHVPVGEGSCELEVHNAHCPPFF